MDPTNLDFRVPLGIRNDDVQYILLIIHLNTSAFKP